MTLARRSVRRNAANLIVAVLIVSVVWTVLAGVLMIHPVYPWDWAAWVGRETIRTIWAALTGQSASKDLFPW